jgi:hypothetical protein
MNHFVSVLIIMRRCLGSERTILRRGAHYGKDRNQSRYAWRIKKMLELRKQFQKRERKVHIAECLHRIT